MLSSQAEHVQEHEPGADADGRIGDVEGPEVPRAPVNVYEIDHVADKGAVEEVSDRTAEDQGEPEPGQALVSSELHGE